MMPSTSTPTPTQAGTRLIAALAEDLRGVPVIQDLVAAGVAPEVMVPTLQRETPERWHHLFNAADWLAVARKLLGGS